MNYDLFEKTSSPPFRASDDEVRDRQGARSNSIVIFTLALVNDDGVALPLGEFGGATFDAAARRAYQQFRGSFGRLHPLSWSITDQNGRSSLLERLGKTYTFK